MGAGLMDWPAWGGSWLASWGSSWGPDAVEEHPEQYPSGGGTVRRRRGAWQSLAALVKIRPHDKEDDALVVCLL